jgi:hypothetical protein
MITKQMLLLALICSTTSNVIVSMNSQDPTQQTVKNNQTLTEMEREYKLIHSLTKNTQRENEICVPMWGANAITIDPTNKNAQIISTSGLSGCTATALHVKYSDGTEYAGITHFPQTSIKAQFDEIIKQQTNAFEKQDSTKKIEAINSFTIIPEEYVAKNNKWELAEDETLCDLLNENRSLITQKDTKQIFNKHCITYRKGKEKLSVMILNKSTKKLNHIEFINSPNHIEITLDSTKTSSITIDINGTYHKKNLS